MYSGGAFLRTSSFCALAWDGTALGDDLSSGSVRDVRPSSSSAGRPVNWTRGSS